MRGRALPAIPRAPRSQTGNSLRKEPQRFLPPALEVKAAGGGEVSPSFKKMK